MELNIKKVRNSLQSLALVKMKGNVRAVAFAKPFVRFLKLISLVSFCSIFGYWSLQAINKFLAKPISSSVSYSYGDDGLGNISKRNIPKCLHKYQTTHSFHISVY